MNPYFIIKQASKYSLDAQPLQREVNPLAQIWAMQKGVNPESLKNRDMDTAMADLMKYIRTQYSTNNTINSPRAVQSAKLIKQCAAQGMMNIKTEDVEDMLVNSTPYAQGTGTDGACNVEANKRAIPDSDEQVWSVLTCPKMQNKGDKGTCDIFAWQHKLKHPRKIKGTGQNIFADFKKFQDLSNPENCGKLGRPGGTTIANV